jgi:hypothetical protein
LKHSQRAIPKLTAAPRTTRVVYPQTSSIRKLGEEKKKKLVVHKRALGPSLVTFPLCGSGKIERIIRLARKKGERQRERSGNETASEVIDV